VFCANFETTDLPTGAVYNSTSASTNWLDDFEIDNSVSRTGRGSLKVKPDTEAQSGSAYQMLAVTSGGNTFWVRFYLRSDQILGQDSHNAFVSASAGVGPNDKPSLEFAEDCGIAFNNNDAVVRPDGSSESIPCMTPLRLEPDTWYCVELSFNGATGDTQLFIDREPTIDSRGWSAGKGAFKYVKFGVNNLHPVTRTIWYDEFAVAPTRIGCPALP
jgi:hypothetical protein